MFIKTKLDTVREDTKLEDWPSESDLLSLVGRCDCLFIYAATVCRFIEDKDELPEERLRDILENTSTGGGVTVQIDHMYTKVLDHALTRKNRPKNDSTLVDRFKTVVGCIITLFDTLSMAALASLIAMSVRRVEVTLGSLHSVLNITESSIRLLHPSFRDFLLDEERCADERFRIRKDIAHGNLSMWCLDVLLTGLTRNICRLASPASSPQEVSKEILNEFLPDHVQYACQYWISHLVRACDEEDDTQRRRRLGLYDNSNVHRFFKETYLYWLEAMSLIGRMYEAVLMITKLTTILTVSCNSYYNRVQC